MHLFKLLRTSIKRFTVKTIKCIQLKSINMVKIWLAVEQAIFTFSLYIHFINDKYMNLVNVYLKYFVY